MPAYAIVPAAGLSTRMGSTTGGSTRKQMAIIGGAPVVIHTLRRLDAAPGLEKIVVAARPEDRAALAARIAAERFQKPVEVVEGGATRQASVRQALQHVPESVPFIVVHDAVRPFVEPEAIARALEAAEQHGAAIAAIPVVDTVKQVERSGATGTRVAATLPREKLVLVQTPQAFRHDWLRAAFARADEEGFHATDESALVEHLGHAVYVVAGSPRNWKITTPSDLELAETLLRSSGQLGEARSLSGTPNAGSPAVATGVPDAQQRALGRKAGRSELGG
ncbi:MAG: 2-C-methyl-D-erythritol 4-phosphate cytidylyltransferase [Terriglobales bacterium]